MNAKRLMMHSLACALVGGTLSTAHAKPALAADPVADGFRRMLEHAPTQSVPPVPAGTDAGADPLRSAICALLWETQSRSFHWPDKQVRVATLNQAGR